MSEKPAPCVATLIASKAALAPADVAAAAACLPGVGQPVWLDPQWAADLPFAGGNSIAIAAELRTALDGRGIDVVAQPSTGRRKKLFLADMDSTMIGQECIDELADFVGLKAAVSQITERAMRGEIAFEPALRERVALLERLPVSVIDEILAKRITLTPGGRTLVKTMQAHGGYACLVSGGFTLFTGPVSAKLGFDEHRANRLLVEADRLVGRVAEPVIGREAKLQALIELRARLGLRREETLAIGDGANDLAMLQEAGLGVAFHAKPAIAAAAQARIDHGDLTALLYAQGYRREEFTEA